MVAIDLSGRKALVTEPLKELCEADPKPDLVVAIGPPIMMKFCAETTRPYDVPTVVSLNTIMIDGTGMCGGCRVTVGDETKFVCVDGPEFDGHLVDFDNMMQRLGTYKVQEDEDHERCHMDLAAQKKVRYDRILILSDQEGYGGGISNRRSGLYDSLRRYQKHTGAQPHVYIMDLAGGGTSELPPSSARVHYVPGFSDKVFDMIGQMKQDPQYLMKKIRAIEI